jgi:hypothetical protein
VIGIIQQGGERGYWKSRSSNEEINGEET